MSDIILDIVNSDMFKVANLSAAMTMRPFIPAALGGSGLFLTKGIDARIALVEQLNMKVGLLPYVDPNGPATPVAPDLRSATPLTANCIAGETALYASDIAQVREFGSATSQEVISNKVLERTDSVRSGRIEPTLECLRAGVLVSKIVTPSAMAWTTGSVTCVKNDLSSGSVTIPVIDSAAVKSDLNTLFGTTAPAPRQFDFTTAGKMSANIKIAHSIRDAVVSGLGGVAFTGLTCWMGRTLFRKMISYVDYINYIAWTGKGTDTPGISPMGPTMTVQYQNGSPSILWQGITFKEYSYSLGYGQTNAVEYLDPNLGVVVPEGIAGAFLEMYAPANFIETVNQIGLPIYAKSEIMRFGKGITIRVESNPLIVCTRPNAMVQVVSA